MINEIQIISWIMLLLGLLMMFLGVNSLNREISCVGMVYGGILFLSSFIVLFYGYVVMGGL